MVHPVYADEIAKTESQDTMITRAFTGRPGRAIATAYTRASVASSAPPPASYPVQRGLTRAMREDARKVGDAGRMQMLAGQAAKLARAEPASIISQQLWEDASLLLSYITFQMFLSSVLHLHSCLAVSLASQPKAPSTFRYSAPKGRSTLQRGSQ